MIEGKGATYQHIQALVFFMKFPAEQVVGDLTVMNSTQQPAMLRALEGQAFLSLMNHTDLSVPEFQLDPLLDTVLPSTQQIVPTCRCYEPLPEAVLEQSYLLQPPRDWRPSGTFRANPEMSTPASVSMGQGVDSDS